jgi:hypothetical protein
VGLSVSFRERPPGRKVRIVKKRLPSKAAGLSLAAVVATSVLAFAVWRWWRTDQIPIVLPITLEDSELDWKCEAGHTFIAPGQVGGRPCPESVPGRGQCGEMAYPHTSYECPAHGPYDVKVQFGRTDSGRARPALYRVGGAPWVAAGEGPLCPRCERIMTRKDVDPLEGKVRPKRRAP